MAARVDAAQRHQVELTVNGTPHRVEVEARRLLADVLRDDLGLTGTHLSCEQGVCGACTVIVDGKTARSCLMLAVQAAGASIETVEGLADGDRLHPLQEAFREHHALQCGFCTPGFLMTAHALLRDTPDAGPEAIREGLDDVVCRCTGYQNIVTAVLAAQAAMRRE